MLIRPAEPSDLPAVQAIYAVEVQKGTGSFELTPPDLQEIERRFQAVMSADLPYVVAEIDGAVAGFAYAHPYKERPGYRLTVETTIYIAREHQRQGLGSAMLEEVIKDCITAGKREMVAVIGDSANRGSIRVHERAGFQLVGTLRNVGLKFDRFLDVVLMQRSLGSDQATG